MGSHGAHDEMQVVGRNRLPVHALEVLEGGLAVAALVLAVSLLGVLSAAIERSACRSFRKRLKKHVLPS